MMKIKLLTLLFITFSIFTPSLAHVCLNVDRDPPVEKYIIRITEILNAEQTNEQLWFGGGDKQWLVDVEFIVTQIELGNEANIMPRHKGTLYLYNGSRRIISPLFPQNRDELELFLTNSLWQIYSKENGDQNTIIEIGKDSYLPCIPYQDHKLQNKKHEIKMKDFCSDGYLLNCYKKYNARYFLQKY